MLQTPILDHLQVLDEVVSPLNAVLTVEAVLEDFLVCVQNVQDKVGILLLCCCENSNLVEILNAVQNIEHVRSNSKVEFLSSGELDTVICECCESWLELN
mmetsp:Transcript_14748/g.14353  ORF Transcript_14748/g.14353 Transcript_14748/m.14353 type:complete len:100 (-) Transcript_14748:660-959(-)